MHTLLLPGQVTVGKGFTVTGIVALVVPQVLLAVRV